MAMNSIWFALMVIQADHVSVDKTMLNAYKRKTGCKQEAKEQHTGLV